MRDWVRSLSSEERDVSRERIPTRSELLRLLISVAPVFLAGAYAVFVSEQPQRWLVIIALMVVMYLAGTLLQMWRRGSFIPPPYTRSDLRVLALFAPVAVSWLLVLWLTPGGRDATVVVMCGYLAAIIAAAGIAWWRGWLDWLNN